MPIHWLDANVFIQSKNGPYSFRVAPRFWAFLDKQLRDGTLASSALVYQELVSGSDDLANWVKNRKEIGLCIKPSREAQRHFRHIADYVYSRYERHQSEDFLRGADPWLIAHALESTGIVVTHESDRKPNARKARIPDVCAQFKVRCINTYRMLDELGAEL